MEAKNMYEVTAQKEFPIVELWKQKGSTVVNFIETIQKKWNLIIHFQTGAILEYNDERPFFSESELRLVLNNEILDIVNIYYDDKQFLTRIKGELKIRRVNLNTIREVQFNADSIKFKKEN